MNRDLFLSILALDSYNRSYGQRLSGLDTPEIGPDGQPATEVKIGNAKIVNFDDSALAKSADFYAIAYEWGGETIISYRGTDNLAKDAVSGYGVGAGFAGVPQGNLALEFYHAVTDKSAFDVTPPQNVVLVGHSLGGGLAGFASMLSGADALLFDHRPFGRAAADRGCALPLNDNQPTSWSIAA